MNFFRILAYVLVLVGALNWGLIGLFDFNLVGAMLGDMTLLARIVYTLVGLAAIISAIFLPNFKKDHINCEEYCNCNI